MSRIAIIQYSVETQISCNQKVVPTQVFTNLIHTAGEIVRKYSLSNTFPKSQIANSAILINTELPLQMFAYEIIIYRRYFARKHNLFIIKSKRHMLSAFLTLERIYDSLLTFYVNSCQKQINRIVAEQIITEHSSLASSIQSMLLSLA